MIKFIPFEAEHIALIEPTSVFKSKVEDITNFKVFEGSKYAWTIVQVFEDRFEVLGCIGGSTPWQGVGECWCYFDEKMKKWPFAFTKAVRRLIDTIGDISDLHRIQGHIPIGQNGAVAWARFLGFQVEGTLRNFGADKSDYLLVAKVWD